MGETVYITVDEVRRETDKAILCVIDDEKVWIPKSQIGEDSAVTELGDSGELEIPEWLAIEKGLV